jgi:zinc protease
MRLPALLAAFALSLVIGHSSFVISAHADAAPPLLFPPAADAAPSGLVADPALVVGELPNGLRYALRANPEPRERASLRLVVSAGSFHETEAQLGLAHFLEHMAFNGSTHYPPGTLIEFFQRMGMNFGGHTNAYTSFDRTVYMLELPNTKPDTLAEGFRVLADYAGGLLLEPAEIERERGVILAEKLSRDSADYRSAVAGYRFYYAGTLLPDRLPIGTEEIIKSADRAAFADFYDTWYRPERLAVIAVGDLDPAVVEKQLRDAFAPLADRAPARPAPALGAPAPEAPRFGHHFEPEASSTNIGLQVVRPAADLPDSVEKRLRELPRDLAYSMLDRRLAELAKAEDAPFVRASVGDNSFPGLFDGASLSLVARPGQWAETLRVGENELRRALRFGFTASELREAVAEFRNALEQAVKTDSTQRSSDRANTLIDAFLEGIIPTTAADDLALHGPALDSLTPADAHEALKAAWSSEQGRRIGVFGNTDLGTPADALAAISAAYTAAEAIETSPPAERTDAAWAYENFGPAGEIAERREIADLEITQVVFANGARLNLKRTDFEAGAVSLRARVGVGQLTEPRDQPGLAFFGGAAFTAGGLGRHSADELRRILAGRNVGVGLRVANDAVELAGQTTPADLALQLQLLAAHLADPGWRAEGELMARRQLDPFYSRLLAQPDGPLRIDVPRLLASGDPRFGFPRRDEVMTRTLDELRAWLGLQLATGPLELSLVGDLDVESAIAAAAATIGALPPRESKPALEELRAVSAPAPGDQTLRYSGAIAKNLLAVYWPTTDARDIRVTRRLNLLSSVLDDRLRAAVREKLGGSYSPYAASAPSDTYRDYGFIFAHITTDPAETTRVREAVLEAASDLAANGLSDDELERALLPVLTTLREARRTNAYWLGSVLGASQEQPERLDWARSFLADHEAITREELNALAREYLDPARSLRILIAPAG